MNEWDEIEGQIKRSKIKRFPWKELFGMTLTEYISKLRLIGLSNEDTLKTICQNKDLKKYCKNNLSEVERIHEKLKISIAARYGEQNAAESRKKLNKHGGINQWKNQQEKL